jgi:hypothetical protein
MHSLNGEHASKSQAGGLEMVKHANRLIVQRWLTIGKISGDQSTFHLLHVWGLSEREDVEYAAVPDFRARYRLEERIISAGAGNLPWIDKRLH